MDRRQRPDFSLQGRDEREVLAKIAKPIARAIAITRTREARETEHRQAITLPRASIAGFEERLGRLEYREEPVR